MNNAGWYQPTWKGLIRRVGFDGLPRCDYLPDFLLADPPLEHPLDSMNPKDQEKLAHSVATLAPLLVQYRCEEV